MLVPVCVFAAVRNAPFAFPVQPMLADAFLRMFVIHRAMVVADACLCLCGPGSILWTVGAVEQLVRTIITIPSLDTLVVDV